MFSKIATICSLASAAIAGGISITPHDAYSSSIGVLGCHIDTNRVAYWPMSPGCNSMCKKVTSNGRSLHLLHVDTSGGAYDISYDAWNYLNVGKGAEEEPTMGGGIDAEYEDADMSACADIIKTPDGKLPLMAANSIGTYVGCPQGSWLHDNSALYNIQNCACTMGFNERCELNLDVSNQPSCAHVLGSQNALSGMTVHNIQYGTGVSKAAA